jgi:RNA recognition motif-containing protein
MSEMNSGTMGKKKSKAQLKRLTQRAEARGEVYVPPEVTENPLGKETKVADSKSAKGRKDVAKENANGDKEDHADQSKLKVAAKLTKELESIETNEEIKAKDRRSAKRKAEAIAAEEAGCSATELLQWYEEYRIQHPESSKGSTKKTEKPHVNPYIVFVGQLSYDTTRDTLFEYIKKELGKEHQITQESVKLRLLTDQKTKKSRGMAFIELTDPEVLYACLKLHQTFVDGRRINVERSAGGGRSSETRKSKLKNYREEQDQYISSVVDKILDGHRTTGEIQENELDEGVVALCKRHSATIVTAALENYIESNGRDMDNSSAYLSFLLTKFAEEGIYEKPEPAEKERPSKRPRSSNESSGNKKLNETSSFAKQGVDMTQGDNKARGIFAIFPSLSARGRGRGRGR